jgi:hypothetical protein
MQSRSILLLDLSPGAVGVKIQGSHHGGVICRTSVSFRIVAAVEGAEIQLGDDFRYKPDKMVLRQPVPYVGGKKKELIPIAVFEVIGHDDPPRQSRSDLQLLDCTVFRAVNNPFKNWFCNRLM